MKAVRKLFVIGCAASTVASVIAVQRVNAATPEDLVRALLALSCERGSLHALEAEVARLPAVRTTRSWVRHSMTGARGWRLEVVVENGRLILEGRGPVGAPQQVEARYAVAPGERPSLYAVAGSDCSIRTAERLRYAEGGEAGAIEVLDAAFAPSGLRRPLNPAVPPGADPGGIAVGVVDTGVNYLLPEIALRLARRADGRPLGHDYQDLDERPFDVPVHMPFARRHHGTEIASILLREAPVARLVPYRYPHAAMDRMGVLVEQAAAAGIRIVNLSLAGLDRAPWRAFLEAARSQPGMLFVIAAGNHGRNLDQRPVYPAAFGLANIVVVTSATAAGELTAGANWGPEVVDLMVPGEAVPALGFTGERRRVSGSSYAAARVSAHAACLLAAHPAWPVRELEAALFRDAEPRAVVRHGFVPDAVLGNGAGCRRAAVVCAATPGRGC